MEDQTISFETVLVFRGSIGFMLVWCLVLCCMFLAGTVLACSAGRSNLFTYLLSCVSAALAAL